MSKITKSVATDEDLKKINQYATKELTADDVYIFNVALCNNDIDRDFEKFSYKSLQEMAPLFVGKTGISDHSMRSVDQKARIFDTWVEPVTEKLTADGEQFYQLKARAYMLNNENNKNLIEEIDAGIKKEVSVSCSMAEAVCSICGKDKRKERCNHINGKIYDGQKAFTILEKPTDAYEFSFVAVPAQRQAGVTKSFEINEHINKTLTEKLAEGRQYRKCDSFKAFNDDSSMIVEGYVARFDDAIVIYEDENTRLIEIFDRKAFDDADFSDVIMQYENQGKVFARTSNETLIVSVDDVGVKIKADISGTEAGRELFEEIKGGYITAIEFGFSANAELITSFEKKENGKTEIERRITAVSKIYNVSAVSNSPNGASKLSVVDAFNGAVEQIQQEKLNTENEKNLQRARINFYEKCMEV